MCFRSVLRQRAQEPYNGIGMATAFLGELTGDGIQKIIGKLGRRFRFAFFGGDGIEPEHQACQAALKLGALTAYGRVPFVDISNISVDLFR